MRGFVAAAPAIAMLLAMTGAAWPAQSSAEKPSVYVAIYEASCGATVPESSCAGAIVDSLLARGVGVYLAPEVPVVATVPPELRERLFGDKAGVSASLSATMSAAGGFSITSKTEAVDWSGIELQAWPWKLDEAAVAAMARKVGASHVLTGTATASRVATDLSDTGLDEVMTVRGHLGARVAVASSGLLTASYTNDVSQVSTSCVLGAQRCFAVLGADAAVKLGKSITG